MLTKNILAAGALLSVAAAIPMQQQQNKRDIVWETQIEHATVTMDVTTTMWLNPGETPPSNNVSPAHFGHRHHPHPPQQPDTTSTAAAAPSPPPAYTPETSPAAAPTTSVAQAPTTYAAPSPATTSEAAASPPAYSSPAATPSSAPSSGGSGQDYTGDLTYYTPGMGSCGETSTSSDSIVALAEGMMTAAQVGGNPNDNPLCGKSITISYGGTTATATIVDTCPGCSGGSLDLTPSLFEKFAPLSEGRLTGMKWWYNN